MLFFSFISSIAAISAPVQAPVPGSGIATKINNPQNAYFCTVSDLLFALFSRRVTSPSSLGIFSRIKANIFLMNIIINGTGIRFPIIETNITAQKGSPMPTPMGIAPRSSITGTIETKKVIISFPRVVLKNAINFSLSAQGGDYSAEC